MMQPPSHPVLFSVEYPDHELNRLTTLLRPFLAIPILVVLGAVFGQASVHHEEGARVAAGAGGLLVLGPLLLILFRQKYPRWWFDWNLELLRFANRVVVYLALMDDRYPSTDETQSVRLEIPYPDAARELNRWLPLVKWLLAVPHYLALAVLVPLAVLAAVIATLTLCLESEARSLPFVFPPPR